MKLYGGTESLYQWDTDRKITSLKFDAGDEVHFSNTANPEALVVEAYALEDGQIVADIPNILLQNDLPLYVYWVRKGAAGCCCADSKMFLVVKRHKPSDYVYTETELKNYEALEKRIERLEKGGSGGAGSGLPFVTEEDNGKFLGVANGAWAAVSLPVYEGEYIVTPSATAEQTLATARVYMDADVRIEKIPYAEVSNDSDGTTVTIG